MAAPSTPVVPPIQITMQPYPALGFKLAVTTAATQFDTSGTDCYGVLIQSSALNDSNSAVTANMYVQASGVNIYELLTGDEVFIPCSNTNQIKLLTQASTAFARIIVYQAKHN